MQRARWQQRKNKTLFSPSILDFPRQGGNNRDRKDRLFQFGEMAEWSIAAVLKTAEAQASGGSNPSLSAI